VPACWFTCVTPGEEPVEVVFWGEDEWGRTVCHAEPPRWGRVSDAIRACDETRDTYCNYARIKHEHEMPATTCEVKESFWSPGSGCLSLTEDVLKRESPGDGALIDVPDDFPDCDVVIEHD
jgi:hypothetical protein